MAAAILGAAQLVPVLISLVDMGIDGFSSLQKVSALIKTRQAEGKPVTQGDVWDAVGDDDAAKKTLEDAIKNA